ncbi:cysteine--1-D-myo-inosityl 2-amino-2-deoxy-alpha-D-glucopyranoside ligase [Streptomyces sp. H10-C2]|uniref:cysteine--1-D-myo-inosityl 2-amino-2-deoxy-alpha-D-glucopyranoside ligase n=1 Tax=unclassified Streptomyces TaxID=2593676 RepID=UPI0024BAFA79|nr:MULTISPECIES: cysteine--1-D-myo-inosityl 2-amino-2-deoxy-alpha-D-glucopyranoside ligase [unclassified Streptomyces]MDJ0346290.1 cysteine--1-D-myo-inosityl 2-amino-2-deoxy-alpha-D-glucopyranoside ligase [Streptomyces sp. PH10-H1]MDJ0374899.1 cysteine--1-D-myo-inosityl 2-amino-2-deoxy-alpha-D-glucopyranoside ligase [Streptomyces sp. H10-C2]
MELFDTATKTHREVQLGEQALIYVCGITPYDAAHLGHAFTFLTYDLLQRRLQDLGTNVRVARNITDVDEPMYTKANELGMHYLDLTHQEVTEFQRMMRTLNLLDPDAEPRPSQHIPAITDSVKELLQGGFAYNLDGDIYFDIAASPRFASVSGYPESLMRGFSAMRGGDLQRPGKRQPLDFLLWRSIADPRDPAAWATSLGRGRPGWHIECSVMSYVHLGPTIDIHGGGSDLIFPHHECENAQSTALGRDPYVKHWMHTAPLLMGGEKMSKSLGNLVFVRDLLADNDAAAVRIALLRYHYRTGGEWQPDLLPEAHQLLARITHALKQPAGPDPRPHLARIREALDHDLDAPAAVRHLSDMTDAICCGGTVPGAADGLGEALHLLGIELAAG